MFLFDHLIWALLLCIVTSYWLHCGPLIAMIRWLSQNELGRYIFFFSPYRLSLCKFCFVHICVHWDVCIVYILIIGILIIIVFKSVWKFNFLWRWCWRWRVTGHSTIELERKKKWLFVQGSVNHCDWRVHTATYFSGDC